MSSEAFFSFFSFFAAFASAFSAFLTFLSFLLESLGVKIGASVISASCSAGTGLGGKVTAGSYTPMGLKRALSPSGCARAGG